MIIDSTQYNGLCSCGREHKMETVYSVIESGCLKNINTYLKQFDLTGFTVAVYDENTYAATADRHPTVDFEIVLNPNNLHANEHGVDMLLNQLPKQAKVIVAIGSGTIHDISRYCAYKKGTEFVSCPTAASVDGFCSSVAAMTWHGCKKTLTAVAPKIVIADIDIIKNAPIHLAKSGFGDMVGKYVALTDWKIGNLLLGEFHCERIAQMTKKATRNVLDCIEGIIQGDELAYENLMYGLLLSGLAMQMIGNSRPASGAEHHISHFIEMQPEGFNFNSTALHGEKVGVGTILAIKEYKRLRNQKNISFCDYQKYQKDYIYDIFGENMGEEILNENINDAAAGIKTEDLKKAWQSICIQIDAMPDETFLLSLYERFGIKSCLTDIEVSEDIADALLKYSPMVRNRLTLMRLKKCFS